MKRMIFFSVLGLLALLGLVSLLVLAGVALIAALPLVLLGLLVAAFIMGRRGSSENSETPDSD